MLHIPTCRSRFCDGVSRRDFLRIGGLGSTGLALPELFRQRASAAARSSKPKSCILVFLLGGPSQQETFDLKPDAPAEVRGPFKPIATNVPGIQICEHLPLLARHADKYTIIRSAFNNGGASDIHTDATYLALTGHRWPQVQNDGSPARSDHHPCIGSVVSYLRPGMQGLPTSVHLPELMRADLGAIGQGAGFLGKKHEPFRILPKNVSKPKPEDLDYRVEALARPRDNWSDRLDQRRELLSQVSLPTGPLFHSGAGAHIDAYYEKAFGMLGSAQVRKAFDLAAEPEKVRTRYRKDIFGQGSLLARRLVEHGVPLVTVLWSGSEVDGGWDLHYDLPTRAKVLLPILDQALSALLEDLSARGMLDDTLVVCMGEFGRAPKIEKAGRGHWGSCYSVLLAGGGIPGGRVYGASDSRAAYPRSHGVGTSDIVATIYHCLGIDSETEISDHLGRPIKLCQGDVIQSLFS
jgi:Protein of unknown function (DUF1501)